MVVVVPFRLLFTSKYLVSQALCLVKNKSEKLEKKLKISHFQIQKNYVILQLKTLVNESRDMKPVLFKK